MASRRYASHQWLTIHQFHSHADAQAFQALVAEQFGDLKSILRPKGQYESAKNVADWRLTRILREQLSGNSFDVERLQIACVAKGYSGRSARSWLTKATTHGIVQRLEKSIYEFLPSSVPASTPSHTPDLRCASCQPELLQCQSA